MAVQGESYLRHREFLSPVCVSCATGDGRQLMLAVDEEAQLGRTFFEVHLDCFDRPAEALGAIRDLRDKFPSIFILATCRRGDFGGFHGNTQEQVRVLRCAARNGADAVDLEIESAEESPALAASLRSCARLMISYHNYSTTPSVPDLGRRLWRIPADWYKIVTTATAPLDNFRLLQFAETATYPGIVVFGMTEMGVASRILTVSYGSMYTYAAPPSLYANAPGQLSTFEISRWFNIGGFSRQAMKYAVIQNSLREALPCALYNRCFSDLKMDAIAIPLINTNIAPQYIWETINKLQVVGFTVDPQVGAAMSERAIVCSSESLTSKPDTFWKVGNDWYCKSIQAEVADHTSRVQGMVAEAKERFELWTGMPASEPIMKETWKELQAAVRKENRHGSREIRRSQNLSGPRQRLYSC